MESLKKITVFPLARPEPDNTHLECWFLWARSNYDAFHRYFEALCRIPLEGPQEHVRFDAWLVIQYECEVAKHAH